VGQVLVLGVKVLVLVLVLKGSVLVNITGSYMTIIGSLQV